MTVLLSLAIRSKCISIYFLVYVCGLRHYIIQLLIFRSILKGACSCDSQWGIEGGVTRELRTIILLTRIFVRAYPLHSRFSM